jgi:hypothetical protein
METNILDKIITDLESVGISHECSSKLSPIIERLRALSKAAQAGRLCSNPACLNPVEILNCRQARLHLSYPCHGRYCCAACGARARSQGHRLNKKPGA